MKLSQILRAFNFSLPVLSCCPRVLNRRTFYVLETLQFHLYSWLQLANSNQNGLYLFKGKLHFSKQTITPVILNP